MNKKISRGIALGIILLVIIFLGWGSRLYMEWLWFQSNHYQGVFLTSLLSGLGFRLAVGLIFFIFLLVNLLLTRNSLIKFVQARSWRTNEADNVITINQPNWAELITVRRLTILYLVVSLVLAFIYSAAVSGDWIILQKFLHPTLFGHSDPLFHKDLSFYMFQLPFYQLVYKLASVAVIITAILVAMAYLVTLTGRGGLTKLRLPEAVIYHLSVLAAIFFGLKAWGYRLDQFLLMYSNRGVVYGPSYTDVHAVLLAYRVLVVVALLSAAAILVNIYLHKFRLVAYSIGFLVFVSVALGGIYPAVVQNLVVEPNEFNREQPYIKENIAFTQQAYNLDQVQRKAFPAAGTLNAADIQQNQDTINSIRLWDWRPLQQTYIQLQEMRSYYNFKNIDIDRYKINGQYRQVMLAPRELDQNSLPDQAKTWVNLHLKYTHGYGVAMSPVNEVTSEGLPDFILKDIPPTTSTNLKVTRPGIYYGEATDQYVVVDAKDSEFDYPQGDDNAYTKYQGQSGILINSLPRRLLLTLATGDYNLLFSTDITDHSRLLYHRNIKDLAPRIAPFLTYDSDPYMVVSQGKLYWLWDAYTVSNMYPYAEPYNNQGTNYIRNAVKVTIDAYTGAVNYYVSDPTDPVIQTYSKIFPGLFKPLSALPDDLHSHLRYPEDMFQIQAKMYGSYHMTDPQVFYNKEDKWNLPTEKFANEEQPMEAYYTITKLPGEKNPEYVLIEPFTPQSKTNMVSWMAGRSDGANYGKLLVYEFPKQKLVYGPMQIEARIDQDTTISQQLTLWDQRGSSVIRGNLLVIPIKDSLLYVEPIYLQSDQSKMPELRRVIVASGDRVVMETSLEKALQRIFGAENAPDNTQPPPAGAVALEPGSAANLVKQANQLYDDAQNKLKNGDWAGYGDSIKQLKDVLNQLSQVTK